MSPIVHAPFDSCLLFAIIRRPDIHRTLNPTFADILGKNTIDCYMWALSIVYSRAIGVTKAGQYIRAIPPVLDMANHR